MNTLTQSNKKNCTINYTMSKFIKIQHELNTKPIHAEEKPACDNYSLESQIYQPRVDYVIGNDLLNWKNLKKHEKFYIFNDYITSKYTDFTIIYIDGSKNRNSEVGAAFFSPSSHIYIYIYIHHS